MHTQILDSLTPDQLGLTDQCPMILSKNLSGECSEKKAADMLISILDSKIEKHKHTK